MPCVEPRLSVSSTNQSSVLSLCLVSVLFHCAARHWSSNADRQTLCSVSSHTALHTFVISNRTSIVFPDCIELRFTLERQMKMADNLAVCVSAEAVVHRC